MADWPLNFCCGLSICGTSATTRSFRGVALLAIARAAGVDGSDHRGEELVLDYLNAILVVFCIVGMSILAVLLGALSWMF